jgi:RNA polymerase sigma-70 factor, ECF subfamily
VTRIVAHPHSIEVRFVAARPIPQFLVSPSFHDVFAEHAAFVLRVVRRLGVPPADVEDVAQEVFMIVHRKLGSYDGTSTLRTWLFGIARRVARDHRNKAHVRREQPQAKVCAGALRATQQLDFEERELRERLDRALDELDEDKRAVFVLFEMEGIAMNEVAAMLDCPLFTAYSRLREARARVRAALADMEGTEP